MESEEAFPSELQDRLTAFDDALTEIEDIMNDFTRTPINNVHTNINPLEKAKLDLVGAYTMNSLFWMYMSVTGENPKEHGIKQELDRIKGYMGRVKEIEDKEKAPKLDKEASKRFIRSALWLEAQKKTFADSEQGDEKKARVQDSTSTSAVSTGATTSGNGQNHRNKRKKHKNKHKH